MSNDLTPPDDDDGFHGSLNSGRLLKGVLLKWTDAEHWVDHDGLTPPSPLLVIAINEALQRWHGDKPEIIIDKPLPNTEELNAAIPIGEWEKGIDGKPRKPWAHVVVVYLVNLATGSFYTYIASTVGAHIAFEALGEAVVMMRALRGTRCMPLVNLGERPMKTNFGMRHRPHLEIVNWKTPGDEKALPPEPSTPRLPSPAPQEKTPATPTAAPPAANSAKAKPAVHLAGDTLAAMSDAQPATLAEIMDDKVPW